MIFIEVLYVNVRKSSFQVSCNRVAGIKQRVYEPARKRDGKIQVLDFYKIDLSGL